MVVTGYDMERIEPKPVDEAVPGYVDRHRIVDANSAVQDFQIPVMAGRGSVDLEISVIDGKEYLCGHGLPERKTRKSCRLERTSRMPPEQMDTLVGSRLANRALARHRIDPAEGGAFAVYDETSCVYYSTIKAISQFSFLPIGRSSS